ncbi:DUF2690 domain-containing protein [Streptomyces sp. NPDC002588]|uniref:helix-turn-helix domain-containing protein n=1 Tax=Streptomyces sp. NPDC002588 TaxID=3154419 RepID=UPI00331BD9D9
MKERTGLSLAGLAERTTFSKSSWERYLNGRTLPPRQAVQELCRLAGEPDGRCLALLDIAKAEWSAPPSGPTPPAPTPTAPVTPARHRGAVLAAVLASMSVVLFAVVLLTVVLLPDHGEAAGPPASASPSANGPACRGAACEGKDPMVMKCVAEPETLAEHVTATGATLQLRYSRACGATWVRMWGTRIGDAAELRGRVARVGTRSEADTYVHTPMTASRPGTAVQACFLPATGGAKECFEGTVG